MNQTDYQRWMERAFLYVEAALATELATPSRVCMSEEYLRSSLVRGLSHSMPEYASRVSIEWDAPWTDSPCWKDGVTIPSQGRKIQHDVRVEPEPAPAQEAGMACEAKWMKQAKSEEIVRDIWKLMLSRSVVDHGSALRCYLLVGGEGASFENAMSTLRDNQIQLNWRDGSAPTTVIRLKSLPGKNLGLTAIKKLLVWNQNNHVRTPVPCLKEVRCVRRSSWYRTLDNIKWRMGMWELSSWGAGEGQIDWARHKSAII
jgi:hypothetical protein